jgi:hypothetical protein
MCGESDMWVIQWEREEFKNRRDKSGVLWEGGNEVGRVGRQVFYGQSYQWRSEDESYFR